MKWKQKEIKNLPLPHYWKMPEWKLHALENDRKITSQKMMENWQLEFVRLENTHPGKYQNGHCMPWKMTEKSHPWKWQKSLENHINPSSLLFNTQLQSIFGTDNCLTLHSSLYFRMDFCLALHSSLFLYRRLFNTPLQSFS